MASSLNPGDVLRITVWRKPELSGEFIIATDGTVSHPLYRSVRVTGIPLPAVETRIREFLGMLEENPQFVVEPLDLSASVRQIVCLVHPNLSKLVTLELELAASLPAVAASTPAEPSTSRPAEPAPRPSMGCSSPKTSSAESDVVSHRVESCAQ